MRTTTPKYILLVAAALLGALACAKNEAAPSPAATQPMVMADGTKIAKVTVSQEGFVPSSIAAKKGEKLSLEFTRTTDKTCATQVAFPDLGITKDLPLGRPVVVEIPTDRARSLTFQCGMGMFRSSVVVN